MGWISTQRRRNESDEAYVQRLHPELRFVTMRKIGDAVLTVRSADSAWYPEFEAGSDGRVIIATVFLLSGNFVKGMDETTGPLNHAPFPADMLAMLSPLRDGAGEMTYSRQWRARQVD